MGKREVATSRLPRASATRLDIPIERVMSGPLCLLALGKLCPPTTRNKLLSIKSNQIHVKCPIRRLIWEFRAH